MKYDKVLPDMEARHRYTFTEQEVLDILLSHIELRSGGDMPVGRCSLYGLEHNGHIDPRILLTVIEDISGK